MNLTDTHPTAGTHQKEDAMKTNAKKTLGGLAALAAAGLALTGCTSLAADPAEAEPQETSPPQLEVEHAATAELPADGSYVRAAVPEGNEPGEMFSFYIDGDYVQVTHHACTETADGGMQRTVDRRETATGEIGENGSVTWYDGGAFTDEAATALEPRAEGKVLLVGGEAFYAMHSGQIEDDSYMHGVDVYKAWTYAACPSTWTDGGEA